MFDIHEEEADYLKKKSICVEGKLKSIEIRESVCAFHSVGLGCCSLWVYTIIYIVAYKVQYL